MASCTDTSRRTVLLSDALLSSMTGGTVVPVTAARAERVKPTGVRRGWEATSIAPVFGPDQGGAIAGLGAAAVTDLMVTDLMVTDHTYSTRLGSTSCSPPV